MLGCSAVRLQGLSTGEVGHSREGDRENTVRTQLIESWESTSPMMGKSRQQHQVGRDSNKYASVDLCALHSLHFTGRERGNLVYNLFF